ncbi:TPA: RHS repeat-associated core domain-containing protein, partial [Salmonella enterica subsp. enterica serovar Mississippi]
MTDNRGLPVRVLTYNLDTAGTARCLVTHTLVDDSAHRVQHRDPRRFIAWVSDDTQGPNLTNSPSLSGQGLRRDSTDSGWQVTLYDAEGRPAWMTDGRGTVNRVDYDTLGRPVTRYSLPAGSAADQVSARYVYGDADTQTPAPQDNNLCGVCVCKYDEGGLLTVGSVALSGAVLSQHQTFLLSADGPPDWQGQESDWAVLLETGSTAAQVTTVTANALAAVLSQTDAAGHSLSWVYDMAGNVSTQSLTLSGQSPRPLLTSLSYSAAGQPLAEVAGNGVTTVYGYEPQTQRLSSITAQRSSDAVWLQNLGYTYDPVGNITAITDGTVSTRYFRNQATDGTRTFSYDALYQLVSASGRENAGAGTQTGALPPITLLPEGDTAYTPYTRNYTYDDSGNLMTLSHTGGNSYSQTMVTDTFSNRSVQQSDGLTPDDAGSYFDVSGNLQQLHAQALPATDDSYGLVWDTDNQLQTVILLNRNQGADNSQSDRELYQYRDGIRVRKQTRTLTNKDTGLWTVQEVRYLPGLELRNTWRETVTEGSTSTPSYSEQLEVATTQAGRSQIRVLHWVLGQPTDVESDQMRYSVDDQMGSLALELDSTGQLISREEYYPYGGTAVWSARNQTEASYKTVRYSGKERDGTGLSYYGYRYYAPWLCRWVNADPAGEVDGLNLFRMVRNNPVSHYDGSGLNGDENLGNEKVLLHNISIPDKWIIDSDSHKATLGASWGNVFTGLVGIEMDWSRLNKEGEPFTTATVYLAPYTHAKERPNWDPTTINDKTEYQYTNAKVAGHELSDTFTGGRIFHQERGPGHQQLHDWLVDKKIEPNGGFLGFSIAFNNIEKTKYVSRSMNNEHFKTWINNNKDHSFDEYHKRGIFGPPEFDDVTVNYSDGIIQQPFKQGLDDALAKLVTYKLFTQSKAKI